MIGMKIVKEMLEVSKKKYKSAMLHNYQQRELQCQIAQKEEKVMNKLVNSVLKTSKWFLRKSGNSHLTVLKTVLVSVPCCSFISILPFVVFRKKIIWNSYKSSCFGSYILSSIYWHSHDVQFKCH